MQPTASKVEKIIVSRVQALVSVDSDLIVDAVKLAKVLKCINDYEKRHGKPPYQKEAAVYCGISYHTIQRYIPLLVERGLVELVKDGKGVRMRLSKKGYDYLFLVSSALNILGISLDQV